MDVSKTALTTTADSFKNTGVYNTSVTLSGTIGAGATATFTQNVTLDENQVFAFAQANYKEIIKNSGNAWQKIPTFDAAITTTPTGGLAAAIYFTINGSTITFTAFMFNPYAGTETISATTIPIKYVTYTVDS